MDYTDLTILSIRMVILLLRINDWFLTISGIQILSFPEKNRFEIRLGNHGHHFHAKTCMVRLKSRGTVYNMYVIDLKIKQLKFSDVNDIFYGTC